MLVEATMAIVCTGTACVLAMGGQSTKWGWLLGVGFAFWGCSANRIDHIGKENRTHRRGEDTSTKTGRVLSIGK